MSEEKPVSPARTAEELFNPEDDGDKRVAKVLGQPQKSADPKALREKALSDKAKELQDENDLRAVLSTPEGVRFMARLIGGPCGWNLPYFQQNNSLMCEIAGRRSIGYQLEQWIADVDISFWEAVRRELEKYRPKPNDKKPQRAP